MPLITSKACSKPLDSPSLKFHKSMLFSYPRGLGTPHPAASAGAPQSPSHGYHGQDPPTRVSLPSHKGQLQEHVCCLCPPPPPPPRTQDSGLIVPSPGSRALQQGIPPERWGCSRVPGISSRRPCSQAPLPAAGPRSSQPRSPPCTPSLLAGFASGFSWCQPQMGALRAPPLLPGDRSSIARGLSCAVAAKGTCNGWLRS